MFVGGTFNKVDKKGRIFVPSIFKEELTEKVILCYNIFGKKSLWCFPMHKYERFSESLVEGLYSEMSDFYCALSDGAQPADVDSAGRILIPADLRELVGITEEVRIVGMGHTLEIWDV